MLKEFKEFVLKGNVVDLAVGVIIGAAFGQIVTSLVNDIIMPPLGVLIGGIDFSDFFFNLSDTHYATLTEAKKVGAPTLNYGIFLNNIFHFLIVAFAIFFLVKQMNKMKKEAPKEEKLTTDQQLLIEIRDLLKKK